MQMQIGKYPAAVLFLVALFGCGVNTPNPDKSFDGPIDGLTSAQKQIFVFGDEAFGELFTAETGLGPVFNAPSCDTCHSGDGRGHPFFILTRFGVGDISDSSKFDYLVQYGGPQLQERSIPGYQAEQLPDVPGLVTSRRIAPQVTGLGLIEFIPDETIAQNADPDDANGDGISGRLAWVDPPDFFEPTITNTMTKEGRYIGRFGWKATAINLLQQVANAYLNDMGITTDFFPSDLVNPLVGPAGGDPAPDPEVPANVVRNLVFYLQTLRAPPRRDVDDPEVVKGSGLFGQIGCTSCHIREMRTSKKAPIEALRDKPVALYSDLLLHNMGNKLADNFPEGAATGREFRTPPLWGIGIIQTTQGGRPFYLHDGRTSDLSEAILLHGGEAQTSRDAFNALPQSDKDAVLAFLKSL